MYIVSCFPHACVNLFYILSVLLFFVGVWLPDFTPEQIAFADAKFHFSDKLCPYTGFTKKCFKDCAHFVVRYDRLNNHIVFAGCSEKWAALRSW